MTAVTTTPTMGASRPRRRRFTGAYVGGVVLLVMAAACLLTVPWAIDAYDNQDLQNVLRSPADAMPMGTDRLGRSMMWRCLLGGAISLGIGLAAAAITTVIGTAWGLVSGYVGGRTDAIMMRTVDVLYGLPYILLVILLAISVDGLVKRYETSVHERFAAPGQPMSNGKPETEPMHAIRTANAELTERWVAALAESSAARKAAEGEADEEQKKPLAAKAERLEAVAAKLDPYPWLYRFIERHNWFVQLASLFVAIGAVSWLTLARVVRGQVLSLKGQPFVEAARATGAGAGHIMLRHILPNLLGPIIVYTTLTVPQAILQESFLSFLGIGVRPPLPSWGNLAAEGLAEMNPVKGHAWLLAWPCALLAVTLLALNFVGDGLRDRFDPRARHRT